MPSSPRHWSPRRWALRAAPTVADLVARWRAEAAPKKRARSLVDDESMIAPHILPAIGRMKIADVRHADIDKLPRKITATGAKVRANRIIALLSRMFSLAVIWEIRSDNPVKGIERNPETVRYRYFEGDELDGCWPRWRRTPTARGRTSSSCCC